MLIMPPVLGSRARRRFWNRLHQTPTRWFNEYACLQWPNPFEAGRQGENADKRGGAVSDPAFHWWNAYVLGFGRGSLPGWSGEDVGERYCDKISDDEGDKDDYHRYRVTWKMCGNQQRHKNTDQPDQLSVKLRQKNRHEFERSEQTQNGKKSECDVNAAGNPQRRRFFNRPRQF